MVRGRKAERATRTSEERARAGKKRENRAVVWCVGFEKTSLQQGFGNFDKKEGPAPKKKPSFFGKEVREREMGGAEYSRGEEERLTEMLQTNKSGQVEMKGGGKLTPSRAARYKGQYRTPQKIQTPPLR